MKTSELICVLEFLIKAVKSIQDPNSDELNLEINFSNKEAPSAVYICEFKKSLEVFKRKLFDLNGYWLVKIDLHQFHHYFGGILNWVPSMGKISYQGKPEGIEYLKILVSDRFK